MTSNNKSVDELITLIQMCLTDISVFTMRLVFLYTPGVTSVEAVLDYVLKNGTGAHCFLP